MLSDRRQRVLSALIEEYVACALPVGSRTLIERYPLGVSSATVRNELSYLEDEGYVVQPHVSSGRIPTDAGYRAFVDDLIAHDLVPVDDAYSARVEALVKSASELDELFERVSMELAHFTDCLSVVLAPSFLDFRFKQISLVSLSSHHFLCIIVTEDGQVFNKQVEMLAPVNSDDLARIQVFLNSMLPGFTLSEVEKGLCEGLNAALRDPLVSRVVSEIIACMKEGSSARSHSLGMSSLLAKPEFTHSTSVIPVMRMLEDESLLLELLDQQKQSSDSDAPMVHIGHENVSESLSGVSVVAHEFGEGASSGIIAVIGPTRMDYSRVIAAVRAARNVLNDV